MGQRRDARVDVSVKVRLFGMDGSDKPFSADASTRDVSRSGAAFRGIQHYFKPGQTIGFYIGQKKYRCKVMWVGKHETPLVGHIGVQVTGGIAPEWGVKIPEYAVDKFAEKRVVEIKDSDSVSYFEYRSERRSKDRKPVRGGARVKVPTMQHPGFGMVTDISIGGCFIESGAPLNPGTRMEVVLNLENFEIRAQAVVRNRKKTGFGVEFVELAHETRQRIEDVTRSRSKFVEPLKGEAASSSDSSE